MSSQCVSIVHVIEYESVILWLKPMRKVNEWVILSLKWMNTNENRWEWMYRMKTDENEWKEWNKMTSYKSKWMNYVLHETSKKRKGWRLIESAGCPHVSNGEGHVTDDIVTHIRKRKRSQTNW